MQQEKDENSDKNNTDLPPGRELDRRVAERLGYKVKKKGDRIWILGWAMEDFAGNGHWDYWGDVPKYSTDIAAAWGLVEKYKLSLIQEESAGDDVEWMCGQLNITGIGNRAGDDLSEVGVKFVPPGRRLATTAPHAICLAVLALPGKRHIPS